ncbi:MAG: hypothetical protein ACK4TK_04615 [Thiobacillaceae bacterium]
MKPQMLGRPGRRLGRLRPLAVLLPAVALAYANALVAGFHFDDFNIIVDNPAVHTLSAWWAGMPAIRPLLKLSYALNWSISPHPFGFHAVNLLLHLANTALVWRLSAHFPVPAGLASDRRRLARLVATLLFALHPIQTEAVTYVSGRSMSLMATFGLAALLCWLEAPERARPRLWRGLALLLFAAAVACKEVAVVLPFLLLLFLRPHSALRSRRTTVEIPVALPLVFLPLLAWLGYGYLLSAPPPRSLAANLASEINALFYLLGQLVRPHALNIDPDLPEYPGWTLRPLLQAGLLAALLGYAWRACRQQPWLGFGLAWWLLCLSPMYSLIPRVDLANERHLYMAGLGLYWILGVILAHLGWLAPTRHRAALIVAMAGLGMLFTALRNADYRDEVSLWRATAQRSPAKARVWNNLGYAHALAGQEAAARAAFLEALRLQPGHVRAWRNLRALESGWFSRHAQAYATADRESKPR